MDENLENSHIDSYLPSALVSASVEMSWLWEVLTANFSYSN